MGLRQSVDALQWLPYIGRDALYSGRTEASETYYRFKEGKKIDCLDRGFNKCKFLPPRKLYHPVLPYKSNSILMFRLCSAFTYTTNKVNFTHSDEERCICGTCELDDVRKAVEMGYGLIVVFEIWDFDKDTNSGGMFAEYVNIFLKLKQESSGYPFWVQSEEDKDRYIEDYRRAEGIGLDKEFVSKNAGQTFEKLKLIQMWGKWAQKRTRPGLIL